MQDINEDTLTQIVQSRFSETPDARLKEIMVSLVKHLHTFAREVQLTEAEWLKSIEYLTAVGQICSETRQEFILLSDVLGLSMLTVAINSDKPEGCTEATVFGPFYVANSPVYKNGDDFANGAIGKPCLVCGVVRSPGGETISGATIEVWQADDEGMYDVQKPELNHAQARGVLQARADGSFDFKTVVPEPYPIPMDGPVGQMLTATCRSPWRPAHLHFMIKAEGYETLITHVFRKGDRYLEADPVFGVRKSLVTDWEIQSDGTMKLDFDFFLNPVS